MPWMDLLDKLHLTVDDGVPETAPKPAASVPVSSVVASMPVTTPMSAVAAPQPDTSANTDMYNGLKTKTDFDVTPMGQLLTKYLKPLEKMGADERTKIQTALELGADNGLTAAKVIETLTGLQTTLKTEGERFEAAATAKLEKEVATRKAQIAANDAKVAELQAEILKITGESGTIGSEVAQWEGRIRQGTAQFTTAITARKIELDQLVSHYTSLLQ